jgi:hypothetical protein
VVEERKTLSLLRRLKLRFVLSARLADSFPRLAGSPGVEVSDFPFGKKGGLRAERVSRVISAAKVRGSFAALSNRLSDDPIKS